MDKHLKAHYIIHLSQDSPRLTICLELTPEIENGILTPLWEAVVWTWGVPRVVLGGCAFYSLGVVRTFLAYKHVMSPESSSHF